MTPSERDQPAPTRSGETRGELMVALAGLVERTRDMVIVVDAHGMILWANAVTVDLLGHDRSTKIGTSVLDLVHPDDRAQASVGFARSIEGDLPPITVRARRTDGTWLPVEVSATNLLDQPLVRGIVLIGRDLSERFHLERRVHTLEHSFTAAFRLSPIGRALVDLQGRWLLVNGAFCRMVRRQPEDLIGKRGSDIIHPDDRDHVRSALARLLAREVDSVTVEHRFVRPDETSAWARFTVWYVFDDDGQPSHFASDVTDVTEVRAARDAEDRARRGFEALIEQSSDIITVLDTDGTWRSSSGAGTRLLGYEKGFDPVGGILALVHPDDVGRAIAALDELRRGERGPNDPLVVRIQAMDGSYRAFETVGQDLSGDPAVGGIVLNSRDVTERVQAEERLRVADARFRTLLEHSSDVIVLMDPSGTIEYISSAHEGLFGRRTDDVEGTDGLFSIHPDDLPRVADTMSALFSTPGRRVNVTVRVRHADGTYRHVEAVGQNRTDDPAVRGIVWNVRDITERVRTEAELVDILEATNELVVVSDPAGRIVYANRSARSLLGAAASGHVGEASTERSRDRLRTEIMPVVRQRGSWSGELELVDAEHRLIPVTATVQAHRDEHGQILRVATVAHDISELKAAQRQLEFEATHDTLTSLPNRALFRKIGDRAVARASRISESLAVLFLDLDGFKLVNDSYGHDTGDVLLGQVARRLRETVRAGDVVARLGGDEFVILCEHPRNEQQMLDLSTRIIETVSQPFTIDEHTVGVGVSIGIAFSRGDDAGIAELIRDADVALYRAKNEGRGRVQVFDETLLG